jgi:hypothetical protein
VNLVAYDYIGGGSGGGMSTGTGIALQVSDADNVNDLTQAFNNFSTTGGLELGGTIDYFTGQSKDGDVHGLGLTIGPTAGISSSDAVTYTHIYKIGSIVQFYRWLKTRM